MSSGEDDLQARLQLAAAVIEHTREAVMVADAGGRVVSVNPAFGSLTGYTSAQAIGRHVRFLGSMPQGRTAFGEMWAAVQRSGHWQGEVWLRRRNRCRKLCRMTRVPGQSPQRVARRTKRRKKK